jgi:tight adherence protein C
MDRLLAIVGLVSFVGLTLILSEFRWFRRPRLTERLAAYAPGARKMTRHGVLSVASFREVVTPLSTSVGERVARLFGVNEELGTRLRRIHSPLEPATFRVRQIGWAATGLVAGVVIAAALDFPAAVAMVTVLGTPILVFLVLEQQVASASAAWQRRVLLELPVIAEQLGMLTSAGWSLGAALNRISTRGAGACAADLRRVTRRIRHGRSEVDALREWSELADVAALDRLVSVLALNRDTTDLGRLVSAEARMIRRETHRETIERIEKSTQQVWVPVTVAALVPGVLLMGVPFLDALALFSSS